MHEQEQLPYDSLNQVVPMIPVSAQYQGSDNGNHATRLNLPFFAELRPAHHIRRVLAADVSDHVARKCREDMIEPYDGFCSRQRH